jgi:D-arabinose 1-dehydrogenase-like Zn-dependent alcohol dehydrogenase
MGGTIVSYGMTIAPQVVFPMAAVLRHVDVRSSTMGSRAEFQSMLEFVDKHKIRPVVSRVVKGLDIGDLDDLWNDMKEGKQFGKLVVKIWGGDMQSSRL